jgi:iron complex outermembrane recepter protein
VATAGLAEPVQLLYDEFRPGQARPYGGRWTERAAERGPAVGVWGQVCAFGGKLTASAAYFDLTKTNIPSPSITHPFFVTVIGKARSTGFEFDMQGEVSPGWKVIANYAHTDARVAEAGPVDVAPVGSRLGAVPIDLLHLWTTYEFQTAGLRGWKIGGGMTFAGPTPYTPISSFTGQMLPDHTVFDLMTAYQFESGGKKWTFQLNATNIFNRVYLNEVQLNNTIPSPVEPFSWINGVYGPLRTLSGR